MTALVELRVTPQGGDGYNKIAEVIYQYPEVESLYLMSGAYDFLVMLREKNLKAISMLFPKNWPRWTKYRALQPILRDQIQGAGFPLYGAEKTEEWWSHHERFPCKKIVEMPSSGIRKFFDIVTEMPDAISLGVGEPVSTRPGRSARSHPGHQGRQNVLHRQRGTFELRKAVCDYTARKIGVSYAPATECFISVGGSEAIDLAFRATLEEAMRLSFPQPCFVSYEPCVKMAGAFRSPSP